LVSLVPGANVTNDNFPETTPPDEIVPFGLIETLPFASLISPPSPITGSPASVTSLPFESV
jgi:hypothetical protein